jgi:Flp pilus assembly pilin Flp
MYVAALRRLREERGRLNVFYGQGLVEYGMIISFVALACILALKALGTSVSGFYSSVSFP